MTADESQTPLPEVAQLFILYQQWAVGESGTLELDENGAGGIRMTIDLGDSSRDDLVVHWNTLAEGIAALRKEIDEHRPGARKFYQQNCPRTRERMRRRDRQTARLGLAPVFFATTPEQ